MSLIYLYKKVGCLKLQYKSLCPGQLLLKCLLIKYFPCQEEECDEVFRKICYIEMVDIANNVTTQVCRKPLVKDCPGDGEPVCRTEYQSECWSKQIPHEVSIIQSVPETKICTYSIAAKVIFPEFKMKTTSHTYILLFQFCPYFWDNLTAKGYK